MRALINGVEDSSDNEISLLKGSKDSLNLQLINDDGTLLDITGGTVSLEVYSTAVRGDTVIKSHAAVLVTPTAGFCTVALEESDMDYGPGTYYVWAKLTDAAADVYISRASAKFVIT